jgi:hypothetical protein
MTIWLRVSFALYLINGLILIAFGVRYFFADELMPYHAETLGIARDGLSAAYAIVIVTLYRATGAGMLVVGLVLFILLAIPFRGRQVWSRWALSAIGIFYGGLSLFLTLALQAETSASVPWQGPAAAVITTIVAHFLAAGLGKAPAGDIGVGPA